MGKQYVVHWAPVAVEPAELLERIDPILAKNHFGFSGSARRLERKSDGLYYALETINPVDATPATLIHEGFKKAWGGVALRLTYKGYIIVFSFFVENDQTTMILDEEGPPYYDQDRHQDSAQEWLTFLLDLTIAIDSSLCVFEEEPVKNVVDPAAIIKKLKEAGLTAFQNPIALILDPRVLPAKIAAQMHFEDIKTQITTQGYSIFSWMGYAPEN